MIGQIDPNYIRARPLKLWSRLVSYAFFEGRPLTTRGTWINPFVFAHFALEKRLPPLRRVEKPIFIIGTGRSGTTIMGILLSLHRDVGFLNEPKALWHAIHPGEDLVGSYDRGTAWYRLGAEDATPAMITAARRIYGDYLFFTCSRRVVDKYPELVFRIPFVRRIFPDARFLFLVRNGWDTCRSIKAWSSRLGITAEGETHDWWGVNNRKWHLLLSQIVAHNDLFRGAADTIGGLSEPVDMAAVEWIATMDEGLKLLKEMPDCVHMVRYEDLTSSPEKTLSDIMEFCDLPEDDKIMPYARRTLLPSLPKERLRFHPVIEPLFRQTMDRLGYE